MYTLSYNSIINARKQPHEDNSSLEPGDAIKRLLKRYQQEEAIKDPNVYK